MSQCFSLDRLAATDCPRTQKGTPRKHFNPNHPSNKWARATRGNMLWILDYSFYLLDEKYKRYPESGRHFCHSFFEWVELNFDDSIAPSGPLQNFSVAISDGTSTPRAKCRQIAGFDSLTPVEQYRLYYKYDKPFTTWRRNKPPWLGTTP